MITQVCVMVFETNELHLTQSELFKERLQKKVHIVACGVSVGHYKIQMQWQSMEQKIYFGYVI